MVDRNDSFLREVNEELRRDQLARLWERYGTFIVAGLVGLFIAVAAYKWREHREQVLQQQTGARFETALKLAGEQKSEDALKAFSDIAKDGSTGYRTLARLRIAGDHAQAGRVAEAIAAYEAAGSDSSLDPLLAEFAKLQAALLRLDQADWTEAKNRLTPLMGEQAPWRAQAREALGFAAFKAVQIEEATKAFEQLLGDRAATQGQIRRAQEMLAVLTDAAAAKSAPATKAEPAKSEAGKAAEPSEKK